MLWSRQPACRHQSELVESPLIACIALALGAANFAPGGLPLASFVRPGKLFTASEPVATATLGTTNNRRLQDLRTAIVTQFE